MAVLEHEFTSTGTSEPIEFRPGYYTIQIDNPNSSVVQWQRSYNGGLNWSDNADYDFDTDRISEGLEPSYGILYRFNCTEYNGTVKCFAIDSQGREV